MSPKTQHNFLTFSQPAFEHILPELSKQLRGSHLGGRKIKQELSQTWDDRFLNAKSDGSSTDTETQHIWVSYPGLTAYPLASWRRLVRQLFEQDLHVSRGYKCQNNHSSRPGETFSASYYTNMSKYYTILNSMKIVKTKFFGMLKNSFYTMSLMVINIVKNIFIMKIMK